MTDNGFEDRLARIRETTELRAETPEANRAAPQKQTPSEAQDEGHDALLEIFLGILAAGMGGLFFFDRAMAFQLAWIAIPVMVVLGIVILRRSMRGRALDVLDAGMDLFDVFKGIANWLK